MWPIGEPARQHIYKSHLVLKLLPQHKDTYTHSGPIALDGPESGQ